MEINISIKDAAGARGHEVSVSRAANGVDSDATADQTTAAAATTLGAINAGPAPAGLAFGGHNAPMPFIGSDLSNGQGHPSDQSAGAAPAT